MVTYEKQDVLMHGANGKVVVHPITNTGNVGMIKQGSFDWNMEQVTYLSPSSKTDKRVSLDQAVRPDLGYRRRIAFASPEDIGFEPEFLICVGECWMHAMFYTDVIEQVKLWNKRFAGYPPQKTIRQFHAEAVRRVIKRIENEGREKYSREDRSYRTNDDWDGIPVVESSTVRLWRVREDEVIRIQKFLSRTWGNGYAPAKGK